MATTNATGHDTPVSRSWPTPSMRTVTTATAGAVVVAAVAMAVIGALALSGVAPLAAALGTVGGAALLGPGLALLTLALIAVVCARSCRLPSNLYSDEQRARGVSPAAVAAAVAETGGAGDADSVDK